MFDSRALEDKDRHFLSVTASRDFGLLAISLIHSLLSLSHNIEETQTAVIVDPVLSLSPTHFIDRKSYCLLALVTYMQNHATHSVVKKL